MRKIAFLFFFFFHLICLAQIYIEPRSVNLGTIAIGEKPTNTIKISNQGSKAVYILRVGASMNIGYTFDSKTLNPSETKELSFTYLGRESGKINETIEIYLSDRNTPETITIYGFADKNLNPASTDPSCPDFSSPSGTKTEVKAGNLYLEVLDSISNKPVPSANVNIIASPTEKVNRRTNVFGKTSFSLPSRKYQVYVHEEGYKPYTKTFLVQKNNESLTIKLQKEELVPQHISIPEIEDSTVFVARNFPEKETPNEVTEIEQDIISSVQEDETFSSKIYAANNIVFLLDISSSMANYEKIDLLKIAMKELTQILRPIDKITIITYSASTNIALPTTNGADKNAIQTVIDSLKAEGLTAGGKGIQKAFEIARSNFIEGGNNQIFLATDGEFNVSDEKYDLHSDIKQNARAGIKISVLGIKNGSLYSDNLEEIAAKGKGNFIRIRSEKEAKTFLVDEVKFQSLLEKGR